MILNGINFGTTFYGLYIIEHYGRRKSLIVGATWMFLMFLIFASVGELHAGVTLSTAIADSHRSLLPGPKRPRKHRASGHRFDCDGCVLHLRVRDYLGPNDLVSSHPCPTAQLILTHCRTICGELYPSRYRAKGLALSTASNWLWVGLVHLLS